MVEELPRLHRPGMVQHHVPTVAVPVVPRRWADARSCSSLEAPESPVPSLQIVEIWIDSTGQQPPALPPGSTEVEVIDGEVVDDHDVIDDSGPE